MFTSAHHHKCSPTLFPLKAAVLAHSSSDSSVNTAHSLLTSGPSQLLPLIAFISVSMGAAARSNLLIMYCISTGPGAGMEHRGVPRSATRSALLLPGHLLPFYRSTAHLLLPTSVGNHSPSSQRHTLKTSHLSYFVPKRQTTVSFCRRSSPNNHQFGALQ